MKTRLEKPPRQKESWWSTNEHIYDWKDKDLHFGTEENLFLSEDLPREFVKPPSGMDSMPSLEAGTRISSRKKKVKSPFDPSLYEDPESSREEVDLDSVYEDIFPNEAEAEFKPKHSCKIKRKVGRPRKYKVQPTGRSVERARNACPEHRRKHLRCPEDCPMRDLFPGETTTEAFESEEEFDRMEPPVKRKRGRPPKDRSKPFLKPTNPLPATFVRSRAEGPLEAVDIDEFTIVACSPTLEQNEETYDTATKENKRQAPPLPTEPSKFLHRDSTYIRNSSADISDGEEKSSSTSVDPSIVSNGHCRSTFRRNSGNELAELQKGIEMLAEKVDLLVQRESSQSRPLSVYTVEQAASLFAVSNEEVTAAIESGQLAASKVFGEHYRMKEEDIHTYMEQNRIQPSIP